jgi:hypothetical protein
MTPDRDIDRILDAFLADGAHEMPDRVLDSAFARIERTSQRRIARTPWRFPQMTPTLRFAALAAAALVIGIAVVPALGPSDIVVDPSPTPYASPQPIPDALSWWWVGDPRPDEAGRMNREAAQLFVEGDTMRLSLRASNATLAADILETAPGVLRMSTALGGYGCDPGTGGEWRYALDEGDTKLILTPIDETCSLRAQVLAGRWTRSSCEVMGACMGRLTAGEHSAGAFDPMVTPRGDDGATAKAREGALRFTVPEGWANIVDWLYQYQLTTEATYESLRSNPDAAGDVVIFLNEPAAMAPPDVDPTCQAAAADVGTTRDELADWLLAHPGLTVTEVDPLEIPVRGGTDPAATLGARVFDVDLAPGTSLMCEGGNGPSIMLLGSAEAFSGVGGRDDQHLRYASMGLGFTGQASDPMRLVLADGLAIVIYAAVPSSLPAWVDAVMPILDSVEVVAPPAP